MLWRSATDFAFSWERDAIATGLKPALRYATKWQSAMIKPAPMHPIRCDRSRGNNGSWFQSYFSEDVPKVYCNPFGVSSGVSISFIPPGRLDRILWMIGWVKKVVARSLSMNAKEPGWKHDWIRFIFHCQNLPCNSTTIKSRQSKAGHQKHAI